MTVCLLLFGKAGWAHRINEYLQATIISLEANQAHASLRLIPGVTVGPQLIALIDSNHDGVFTDNERRAYALLLLGDQTIAIDGQFAKPQLDSYIIPDAMQLRDGLGEIAIRYHVDLPPAEEQVRRLVLVNRHLTANSVYLMNAEVPQQADLRIVDQKRNQSQSVYELDYTQSGMNHTAAGSQRSLGVRFVGRQFSSLFFLGMNHIAKGTDHLLFLLVLLLPAPLLAAGHRWRESAGVRQSVGRIFAIVTAFTIGHSLTLTLAAMHFVHVASRPVEVLIAVSVLVSAVHALRPLFPGKEPWIAAFFGLIHGLAFAATLDRLGLSRWNRLVGVLAFNLGIETMQLWVVAAIMPSLLIMSRTQFYSMLRICGAIVAGLASIAWISLRLFHVQTPVESVISVTASQGVLAAAALLSTSLACRILGGHLRSIKIRTQRSESHAYDDRPVPASQKDGKSFPESSSSGNIPTTERVSRHGR